MAQRALAEVDQRLHLGIRVVDTVDHGELVARSAARLLDVQLDGLVQAGERVLLHAGHELVARSLYGGVQRDGERELLGKLGEPSDTGDDTAGGDGQMARPDREAVGVVEDSQRGDGLVEVGERLALAHEDDARDPLVEVAGDVEHLVDDLAGGKGAGKPVEAGGAKRAPHGAARLRGDADRQLVARGHSDGFHRSAVCKLKQIFTGTVAGDLFGDFGRDTEDEALDKLITQLLGQVGHLVERGGLLGENPFAELLGAKRGLTELGDHIGKLVAAQRADVLQAVGTLHIMPFTNRYQRDTYTIGYCMARTTCAQATG